MAVNADAIVSKLTLDTSGFEQGVTKSKALIATLVDSSKTAGDKIGAVGTALEGLGTTLTKTVTAGVAAAAAAATAAAVSLDDVSRKVVTIADTSLVSMEQIKDGLSQMAAETGQSAQSLGEGMYSVISATGNTADALAYTEIAAKAAVGGFTDTQVAVDGLTTVMNAYGMVGSEAMQKVSDQMLMTQNYGKTTFGELSSSIGQVIPLAATLGVTTDDLFGSVAVLTKQGIATSSAMAGLKAAYSNVLKPTADASKVAKELGIDFSAAAIESKGWVGFLNDIAEKTGGDTEVLASLFGSVEALNTVLALTSETGRNDMVGALEAMGTAAGATEAAFGTMTDGVSGQWAKIKQQFTGIAASFGELLLPTISSVLEKLKDGLAWFSNINPAMQQTIINIAGVAAALGPVVTVMGKVATVAGTVTNFMCGPAGWITLAIAGVAILTKGLIDLASAEKRAAEQKISDIQENYDFTVTVSSDTSAVSNAQTEAETAIAALRAALMGIDILSQEDQDAIIAAINGDKQPILDRLTELGIDPSAWAGMDGEIDSAKQMIVALLKSLGLSDAQIKEITDVYDETEDKILAGTPNLFQSIFDTLTDGKSDTEIDPTTQKSQADTLAESIVEWRDGLIRDTNAAMETKLKDAKEKLDAGIITEDMYNKTVEGIKAENAEIVADIEETSSSMLGYVETCADAQTQTVEQTEKDLEGLEDKANNVVRRVQGLMTQAEEDIARNDYNLLMQGVTPSTELVNTAMSGKVQERDKSKAAAEEKYKAQIDALNEMYTVEDGETLSPEQVKAYNARVKEIEEEKAKSMTEADDAFAQAVFDLADVMIGNGYKDEAYAMAREALEETDTEREAAWEAIGELTGDYKTKYEDLSTEEQASVSRTMSVEKGVQPEKYVPYTNVETGETRQTEEVVTPASSIPSMQDMKTMRDRDLKAGTLPMGKKTGDGSSLIAAEDVVPAADGITNAMGLVILESAEDVSEKAGEAMAPVGDSMVDGVVTEINARQGDVTAAGASIGSGAFGGLKTEIKMNSPSKLFATAGESMVDGIIMGAGNRKEKLKDKFKELAKAALQAAKDELGIASPSKKFAELGKYSVEGFAKGANGTLMAKSAQMIAQSSTTNNTTYNLSFPNMSVRSDNDVRMLSKQLETSIARANAGRGM